MTYWEGLILGVVQGLTEFLPISSSGHLVVAEALLGVSTPGVVVEVVVHVATVLAVVVVYHRRLGSLVRGAMTGDRTAWHYLGLLMVGTLPAGVIGGFFSDFFERTFESLLIVGVSFLVTGGFLWSTRSLVDRATLSEPTVLGTVAIGFAQALAIFPGISRSGATVSIAMWAGMDPVRAAEFSFLLAIPAIGGAAILQLSDFSAGVGFVGGGPLTASFVAALISGIVAIKLLIALLRSRAFHLFAPYVWVLGILTIGWTLLS